MVDTQLRVYTHPRRSSMARTRRASTPEFQTEAVQPVTEQGYSVAGGARSLGLNDNLIRSRKQAPESKGSAAER
jgi:transposase-like protein